MRALIAILKIESHRSVKTH